MESDPHYQAIREFYGEQRAERSGVLYIRHIDEGLAILTAIDASLHAKRAYCLHPVVQADAALATAFDDNSVIRRYQIDTYSVALAVEYRSIANAYLSHRVITAVDEIQLSPLADVQDMLIADKGAKSQRLFDSSRKFSSAGRRIVSVFRKLVAAAWHFRIYVPRTRRSPRLVLMTLD